MPVVTNTIQRPGTLPPLRAAVKVELVDATTGDRVAGYVSPNYMIEGHYAPPIDAAGVWSLSLVATSLISPTTQWKITEIVHGITTVYYVTVPDDGGPYWVGDILSDGPGPPPAPFVPSAFNKAMVSTLAYESPREVDGTTLFTWLGTRYMAAVGNATVVLWKESALVPGTWGRRTVVGTMPSTNTTPEGEGMAFGEVGGAPLLLVGDQNNNQAWAFAPDTADLMGAWSRSTNAIFTGTYSGGADGVHDLLANDWDGDGHDDFVLCVEGDGVVKHARYDGSGSVLDNANWVLNTIATIPKARTIGMGCPADLAGNGRDDIIVCCRANTAGAQAFILAAPNAAGVIAGTAWTATGLTGHTYSLGAMWACLFDATGDGNRVDIATFDGATGTDGNAHYWLASENYSTIRYFPDVPLIAVGDNAWVIGSVPDPTGVGYPDILFYVVGSTAPATTGSKIVLYYWDGAAYVLRDNACILDYGHALESISIPVAMTGLPNRGEVLMSDSGDALGGQRMALFSFFDDANVETKTAPTLAQAAVQANGAGTLAPSFATDPTAGHLLVALVTGKTTTDFLDAAVLEADGWEPTHVFSGDTGFMVYRKIATGALNSKNMSFPRGAGSGVSTMMVTVYDLAGADTTDPFMTHRSRKRPSGNSTTITNPALVLDQVGVLVIGCWAFQGAEASITLPTGFTQDTLASGQRKHATGHKAFSAVGTTGTLDATVPTGTNGTAFSLAIRGTA